MQVLDGAIGGHKNVELSAFDARKKVFHARMERHHRETVGFESVFNEFVREPLGDGASVGENNCKFGFSTVENSQQNIELFVCGNGVKPLLWSVFCAPCLDICVEMRALFHVERCEMASSIT